jgi:hypothetical protein
MWGTAAAVANAVYHATGIRVRQVSIRLEKLADGKRHPPKAKVTYSNHIGCARLQLFNDRARPRDVAELPRKQPKSGIQADVTTGRS